MSFLEQKSQSSPCLFSLLFPTSYSTTRPHHILLLYTSLSILRSTKFYHSLTQKSINLLSRFSDSLLPLIYNGLFPDFLIRLGIRLRLYDQLLLLQSSSAEDEMQAKINIISSLKIMPIAVNEHKANEQHYEVPPEFFSLCLGPRKKYSSGLWPTPKTTFEESEVAMLELYCQRAGVKDGMKIVDLGCGWGSLTLFLVEKFPNVKVTSISNSHSQREYILKKASEDGLKVENINVITCNVNEDGGKLDQVKGNDLVISIEMFEHMKNYSNLLQKIHSFLKPNGKLFLHIFTHKSFAYHFESGWLAENFFTGGTMPSDDLILYFGEHFSVENHWRVNGSNYQKTSNGWLKIMDQNWKNGTLKPVLKEAYGQGKEKEWYVNWRLFFMACAELWGFRRGEEWIVSHYLMQKR